MNDYELEQGPGGAETRTYFVIGESRTNADNAITKIYGSFYLAFEVSERTEQVVAFSCTHTLDLTENFLRKLFWASIFPPSTPGWRRCWSAGMAGPPAGRCWYPTGTRSSATGPCGEGGARREIDAWKE